MDLGLEGKVALVTGVSQGIGLACAISLLAEGARVLGTSRSAPTTIAGLTHVQLDMTKPGAAERAVEETVARLGSLDILVNNVGSGRLSTGFADESDAHWAEVFELNLMTAIRTTRAALPHLVEGGGVVVNLSSVNGHLPSTSIYAYSAGKAAMDNLTVGLSQEFARRGVRVVGVAPGPVNTPLWLGPTGVAATVAARAGSDPAEGGRRDDRRDTDRPVHDTGGSRGPGRIPRKRTRRHDHRNHDPHRRRHYSLRVEGARGASPHAGPGDPQARRCRSRHQCSLHLSNA